MKKELQVKGFVELDKKELISIQGGRDAKQSSASHASGTNPGGIKGDTTIGIPIWGVI